MSKNFLVSSVAAILISLYPHLVIAQWIPSTDAGGGGGHFASNGTNVYYSYGGGLGGALIYSSDQGNSWVDITPDIGTNVVGSIFSDGNYLFATVGDSSLILRSSDDGMTWDSVRSTLPLSHYAVFVNAASIVCGGTNLYVGGDGISYSSDNGSTWVTRDTGLPEDAYVVALLVSGSYVYAGTSVYGVYRSTDSGISWVAINNGLITSRSNAPGFYVIFSLASLGNYLFVGSTAGRGDTTYGIYRSSDSGETWVSAVKGLSNFDSAWSLAVANGRIFASLDQGGVYYSSDSGGIWISSNSWADPFGSNNPHLTRNITATNQTVFVDVYLRGLWQRPVSDFNQSGVAENQAANSPTSLRVFPNPATDALQILSGQAGTLYLFDLMGRERMNANNDGTGATLDVSHLESGIYFLRSGNQSTKIEIAH